MLNEVSVFLCKWVELSGSLGTILSRQEQLKDSTSLQAYIQNTDGQMQNKAQLEILRRQIHSCVNTNGRPEKMKTLIESWLRVRDQTVAYSKGKLALPKALPAAQKKT